MDSPHYLNTKQYEVIQDTHRNILYSGGYGCGKTLLGCYWVIEKSRRAGSIGAIMAPTIKMLLDNIINPNLIPLLDQCGIRYEYKRSFTELKIVFPNQSEIRCRAFDDEGKMRGADLGWIWLDEAIGRDRVYLTEERFSQMRARLRKGDEQQFLITTNPGSQNHFLYKYFVSENTDPDNRSVHFGSIYDNTHLSDTYIHEMESTFAPEELKGEWLRTFGVVYDQFSVNKHVNNIDPDPSWSYYLGVDFGYTNPFACLLIGVDSDNNVYVISEYYRTKTLITEHIAYMNELVDKYRIKTAVCDWNDANSLGTMRENMKIDVIKASKKVLSGIRSVQRLLREETPKGARLQIDSSCKTLIAEFENYAWEPPRDGKNEKEEPVKFMDHGLDALRYFVFTIIENRGGTVSAAYSGLGK